MSAAFFEVAAYAFDGELSGTGPQEIAKLSAKWLGVCADFLNANLPVFDDALGGPLAHIKFRWTSFDGAALVTASVNDILHSSYALIAGTALSTDSEVLSMFVKSLRDTELVKAVAQTAYPFSEVMQIAQRPLMVVVVWPTSNVSEQDNDLVREMMNHLAGAYFTGLASDFTEIGSPTIQ